MFSNEEFLIAVKSLKNQENYESNSDYGFSSPTKILSKTCIKVFIVFETFKNMKTIETAENYSNLEKEARIIDGPNELIVDSSTCPFGNEGINHYHLRVKKLNPGIHDFSNPKCRKLCVKFFLSKLFCNLVGGKRKMVTANLN